MSTQLTAVFRDEAPYLHEWIMFHLMQGIDQIILYNDRSQDDWASIVKPFAGTVEVRHVPKLDGVSPQLWAYTHANQTCRHDWLGLWDLDEFMFPTAPGHSIPSIVRELDRPDLAMLNVCWVLFQSDLETQPEGLVIENYTRRTVSFPATASYKSLLKVKRCQKMVTNPHFGLPLLGNFAYDERGRRLIGKFNYPDESVQLIRLNHYYTKSREEWLKKMAKGRADTLTFRDPDEYDTFNALPSIKDESALRFVPRLKELL